MQFEHHGRHFHMIRASDLKRDGVGLELHSGGQTVAEIFYSDVTREFTISVFEQGLPLAVIEQLIASARVALLPIMRVHDGII